MKVTYEVVKTFVGLRLDGYTYAEMAKKLGVSISDIAKTINRIRKMARGERHQVS